MIILFIVSVILAIVYIKRHTLLSQYANFFVINDAKKGADGLLILSGADVRRGIKAIELYKKEYAPTVMITTVKEYISLVYPDIIKTRRQTMREIFAYENIPLTFIPSIKKGATSTFDEAYDMAYYLKKYPMNRIIIITDGFHTRRSQVAFRKIFTKMGIHTDIQFAPIISDGWQHNWYKSEYSLFNLVIREPIALLYYIFNDSNSKLYMNE